MAFESCPVEAHDAGANGRIISKSKKGDPHTVLARGAGLWLALGTMDPEDNWMTHGADTLREGELNSRTIQELNYFVKMHRML